MSELAKHNPNRRLLAVASGGGHWEQLKLLHAAFADRETYYATTLRDAHAPAGAAAPFIIPDCNRNRKLATLRCALVITTLLLKLRPTIVISTGALPGLIAIAVAKRLGARTIWVDSVANSEELSLAGARARAHADLWLTQWEAVAAETGATYAGRVL